MNKTPYKVLHIITKLELGGAQQNTLYTAANTDKNNFTSKIASGEGGILGENNSAAEIIYVPSLKREINPLKDILAFLRLCEIIKLEKPDIVHTHSSKAGIIGRLAARFCKTPLIIHTFHGFGFNDRQSFIKKLFFILLEKTCARLTDILIFVSKANMQEASVKKIGQLSQYKLIRSGIPLSKYPSEVNIFNKKKDLNIPEKSKVVLSIGNLKPQKNPKDFIKLAKRITSEKKDVYFIFAGGGEGLEEIKNGIEKEGFSHNCRFIGWRKDTAEILKTADIFILTSLWEGLPRSLVEALKTGIPSICYETDGVPDILKPGENGYLIKQGDIEDMYNKTITLLENDKLRLDMSLKVKTTELGDFEISHMVKELEKLYSEEMRKKAS